VTLARIPKTELSYYSILQHYGKPTPLIDFTFNFLIALFFSLEHIDRNISKDITEMDNYFSIFFINEKDINLIDTSEQLNAVAKFNELSNDYFRIYEDYSEQKVLEGTDRIRKINSREVFFLRHNETYKKIVDINNNQRIIVQEGAFVYNDFEYYPLEEALKLFLQEEIEVSRVSPWDDMDLNNPLIRERFDEHEKYAQNLRKIQGRLSNNIITCFEINKRLINEIKKVIPIPGNEFV